MITIILLLIYEHKLRVKVLRKTFTVMFKKDMREAHAESQLRKGLRNGKKKGFHPMDIVILLRDKRCLQNRK